MNHHDAEETVRENVRQLSEIERTARDHDSRQDRGADKVTRFSGSMAFVWIHVAIFTLWIVGNLRIIPGFRPWDPFPFELLTMAVSLEAILLSTFVLLSQNRQQETSDARQKLDLHMNLLTEEKATVILQMLCRISDRLDQKDDCERQEAEDSPHAFSHPTNLVDVIRLVQNEDAHQESKARLARDNESRGASAPAR